MVTLYYFYLKSLCSYPSYITATPGKEGRVIWFTGAPGAGKSTTAQMLAKEKDYRYYEADCMMALTNPFLDIHAENVFNAQVRAKPLAVSDENHPCLYLYLMIDKLNRAGQGRRLKRPSSLQVS